MTTGTTPPQDDRITPPGKIIPPAPNRPPSSPLEDHRSNWIPPGDNSSPHPSNRIRIEHDRTTPPPDWIPTDEIAPHDYSITPPFNRITPTTTNDRTTLETDRKDTNMIDEVKDVKISAGICTQNNSNSGISPQVNNMFHADSINITNGTFIQNNAFADPLDKLKHVASAGIHTLAEDGCMEGTRVSLLDILRQWSMSVTTPPIFWLDGMAGTGKSAIARSFCRLLDGKQQLGGSFFCRRGDESRATVKRILPTLACFLARRDFQYRTSLLEILRDVPDVADYNIAQQVKFLLEKPLRCVSVDQQGPLVLTIDALDECADAEGVKQLLNTLLSVAKDLPVKFFLTSRPEPHIIARFQSSQPDFHRILRLHEIEKDIVEADISLYLDKKLNDLRSSCPSIFPSEWPTLGDIKTLTQLSGKLFIYAFTAFKYIEAKNHVKRLQTLTRLTTDPGRPFYDSLDKMYSLVLSAALDPTENTPDEIRMTMRILGSIISIREPLELFGLARLLMVAPDDIWANTDRIRAVVNVPPIGEDGVVSTFHASFADFLTTSGRAPQNMSISLSNAHRDLANGCLGIMDCDLHFNIADCKTSYLLNPQQTLKTIPASLKYASLHWAHHIDAAEDPTSLLPDFENLLFEKFLFWLEVLSVSGMGRRASSIISKALKMARRCGSETLATFLYDAKHFVFMFQEVIDSSVAHIYLSALPSVHETSKIAEVFIPKYPSLIKVAAVGIQQQQIPLRELRGHTSFIDSVSFSPDGTRVVSGSSDNTIGMWDVETGELIMALKGHTSFVASVSFSPDGQHLVSGSGDKMIRVWDAGIGVEIKRLEGHTAPVVSVRFSQDGSRIVSGSLDRTIRIWSATTGKEVMKPLTGHTSGVTSIGFSPDGTYIVSGSQDNTIRIWDAKTGNIIMRLEGHASHVNCVGFSPDGTRIVSGSLDKTIRIWNATTGKEVMKPLTGHLSGVTSVGFSPDGAHIVSGSQDNTIRIWDARRGGEVTRRLMRHTDPVTSVGFSPDGTHIVSGSWDQTIQMWEVRTGDEVKCPEGHTSAVTSVRFSPDGAYIVSQAQHFTQIRIWDVMTGKVALMPLTRHTCGVTSVAFSPDGNHVMLDSYDYTIRMWDLRTGEEVMKPLTGHTDAVSSVAFSPDGNHVVSGSHDKTIRMWDLRTGKKVMTPLTGHTDAVTSVAFSPGGNHVVSGSSDETIRMWDLRTGKEVMKPLTGHTNSVTSVAFSPGGNHVVSGSHDQTIRMWDLRTGKEVMKPLTGHTGGVTSVAISHDGNHVVSRSSDETRMWDLRTGKEVMKPPTGHPFGVTSVAFSPDGNHVVSGFSDKTIRMWDLRTGEEVMKPLTGHTDAVTSIAFSPDGTYVVSGSNDKTIRMWDMWASMEVMKPLKGNVSSVIPSNTGSTSRLGETESPFQPHLYFASISPGGWIRGPHQELILWVLPEWRNFVQLPPCVLSIGQPAAHFSLRHYVHGLDWIRCISHP